MRAVIDRWLFTILILLVPRLLNATSVDGFVPPPKMPNIDHLHPTLKSPPISKIIMGKLVLELELTTLNEVKKSASAGVIQHMGDAGGSEYWLCYSTSLRRQPERIWVSSGELGGSEHAVGIFYAEAGSEMTRGSADCPGLPLWLRPVSFGNSLWLGSSPEQLKELFGKPSAKMGNWWFYSYSGKAPLVGFDQLSILGVGISNGKVVGLFVSQATTN